MENKITFEGKEIVWEYKICACLECPIFKLINGRFEDYPDIRKDPCWSSGCLYSKRNAKMVADEIYQIMKGNKEY